MLKQAQLFGGLVGFASLVALAGGGGVRSFVNSLFVMGLFAALGGCVLLALSLAPPRGFPSPQAEARAKRRRRAGKTALGGGLASVVLSMVVGAFFW